VRAVGSRPVPRSGRPVARPLAPSPLCAPPPSLIFFSRTTTSLSLSSISLALGGIPVNGCHRSSSPEVSSSLFLSPLPPSSRAAPARPPAHPHAAPRLYPRLLRRPGAALSAAPDVPDAAPYAQSRSRACSPSA
jgi:hypothetical protein